MSLILPSRKGLLQASSGLMTPTVRRTHDATTYDRRTIDSTGAFLVGELERLDQNLHEPLVTVTWPRDIDLREDVTIADEASSFTNSTFAAAGGVQPNGKAWVGKTTNAIPGVSVDIAKTSQPLNLWAMEISYTIPELESSLKLGRPIDVQKYNAMQTKHQMDIDEQVYIGDTMLGQAGLTNSPAVTVMNAVNGAGGNSTWASKTHDEILADVNTFITSAWAATGWAIAPRELRLPPVQFGQLVSRKVSDAGNISVIEYLRQNSISNAANGVPLNIQPLKWLTGRGTAGKDRMMVYTRDRERVRFPMTLLQRTPLEYRSLFQITTYFGRIGAVEFVYPETMAYMDGI